MSWLTRYRIQLYLRNSIWVFPAASIVAGLVSLALLSRVEQSSAEAAMGVFGRG